MISSNFLRIYISSKLWHAQTQNFSLEGVGERGGLQFFDKIYDRNYKIEIFQEGLDPLTPF